MAEWSVLGLGLVSAFYPADIRGLRPFAAEQSLAYRRVSRDCFEIDFQYLRHVDDVCRNGQPLCFWQLLSAHGNFRFSQRILAGEFRRRGADGLGMPVSIECGRSQSVPAALFNRNLIYVEP